MIRQIRSYSPPAPPRVTGSFKQDFDNLRNYLANQLLPYQFNFHGDHVAAFNNGPQGEGAPLVAASMLTPSAFIHHVTGSATVTTIAVPPAFPFAGQLSLIADAGLTLQTGGNIARSKVLGVGDIATLTYSQQAAKWYLISVVTSLGDVTDASSWLAATAYLLADSIIDSNGNLQQVTTAGTSGAVQPVWNLALGGTTADGVGALVWTNRGAPPIPPTRYAVRSIDVNHRSMVDLNQTHPNKSNVAALNGAVDGSGNVVTNGLAPGAATANGTVTDNTSQAIGTTDVVVATFSITVNAASDIVTVNGRVLGTFSGYDFTVAETTTVKLKRGATTVDSSQINIALSGGGTGSGKFASAFALYDTGVSGLITYTVTMAIGNNNFTLTKTSALALAIDHKR